MNEWSGNDWRTKRTEWGSITWNTVLEALLSSFVAFFKLSGHGGVEVGQGCAVALLKECAKEGNDEAR